jgi:alanine-glyoxylate transaminase/serine-glyoxylate transaminase/serine-pyruvate transaminase
MSFVAAAPSRPIGTFLPPHRLLLGPGPSPVHPRVLQAMARPTIGHLDPAFAQMMEDLKALLRYAFQTDNELTFALSGPGSLGMETCFVNLIEPGDRVLVCVNGLFGARMAELARRCGAEPILVEDDWGRPVDPNKVERALRQQQSIKAVAFVHAETSTGARSDAKILAELAHRHGALTIVDAVTSLGGSELRVDAWGLDAVYAGSQKCLSCPPGLAPVTFSSRALEIVRTRHTPNQSWFMDLALLLDYWSSARRSYHHTAPINSLYGLHEALLILREEGLEQAWRRHHENYLRLKAGLEALGLDWLVAEPWRLPQLNAVRLPAGVDEGRVRNLLLEEFGLEIGAGLGRLAGKIWRIGLMGHGSREENVEYCLNALGAVLKR